MIEDPVDHKGFCPRCGEQVMGTDYACPRCALVLPWKKKPEEEEAEESAAEVCKCGHRRDAHVGAGTDFSPCIKPGCSCTAFTPQPTASTE